MTQEAPAPPTRPTLPRHRAEYALFRLLKAAALRLPAAARPWVEAALAGALRLLRVNLGVVRANLRLAFPELDEGARREIERQNYRWSARMALELLTMDRWVGRARSMVAVTGVEELEAALEEGRGAMVVSGHFGNWEMIVPWLAESGYESHIYVGEQTNPLINEAQIRVREAFGMNAIRKGPRARFQFMRAMRGRGVLAMMSDQNDRKSDLFVDFFGVKAAFHKGLAGFHVARGTPLVHATCRFTDEPPGLALEFERLRPALTGDKAADILAAGQCYMDAVERAARAHPGQYFWMHRRWRTRPPGDARSFY